MQQDQGPALKKDTPTIIVGAGVIGASTAYALARRGHPVVLLDREVPGEGASFGNAGIVALGHPPLPRPGLVAQGIKWMFDPASPLYVPLRPDPALLGWLVHFARACSRPRFEASTRVLADLGHAAGRALEAIVVDEEIDCHYDPIGWLEVYRTEAARAAGRHDAELLRGAGYEVVGLDRSALLEREPAFAPDVIGAVHYREGASIHPGRFIAGLLSACVRHGVELRTGTEVAEVNRNGVGVCGVRTRDGEVLEGGRVVLAAGSWTTGLADAVGLRIPMQPGKGYHVQLSAAATTLRMGCVLAERHTAVTPMGDHLRLAGTVELSGLNHRLVSRRVEMLTEGAALYLPSLAGATASEGWCGLRPCTADGLPVIGWAPRVENLFVATGHAKMGLTLGPITGRLVAEWLLDGAPSIDLGLMSPGRFA